MIRVTNCKVRVEGKHYSKDEIIEILSLQDEERLIKLGYAERIGETTTKKENFLMNLTVDEGKQWVDSIDDMDILQDALENEEQGKNRKGLIGFINNRMSELENSN